jgi:predicted CXXCH cytochrome family protein
MRAVSSFASSQECRDCHPREYSSWHASFHRRMTQVAGPDTVLGPFDGTKIENDGQVHRPVRRGDEFWLESSPAVRSSTSDDISGGESAITARRAVMTTGSHHMQLFWTSSDKGNLLDELPIVYIRDERPGRSRWAPLEATYLSPSPPGMAATTHWNTSCILCHATGGKPSLDAASGAADTKLAELGVACEACHGPADRHVQAQRERAAGRAGGDEKAIVNPARLHPERGAQVCGHCHALASFVSDQLVEDFFVTGSSYRPGDELLQTRMTVLPAHLSPEQIEAHRQYNPFFDGSYWSDGMVRVAGREYNGLLESTCYQKGAMTCLSCHSMHDSDPNDQLAAGKDGNDACYQCHASYRQNLTEHTHHAADSTGSQCYNCHMPHTTYGLFKAIRSHQISSPSAAVAVKTGRPTGCNLCHLDQTLEWTSGKLQEWYAQSAVPLDDDQQTLSAAAVGLVKGDAVQRTLWGWIAGWRPAMECGTTLADESATKGAADAGRRAGTVGRQWLVPLLALLLEDNSPVVRLVASRSLAALDERYEGDYDFAASAEHRATSARQILDRWSETPLRDRCLGGSRVLVSSDGQSERGRIEGLLRQRDERPLRVSE